MLDFPASLARLALSQRDTAAEDEDIFEGGGAAAAAAAPEPQVPRGTAGDPGDSRGPGDPGDRRYGGEGMYFIPSKHKFPKQCLHWRGSGGYS